VNTNGAISRNHAGMSSVKIRENRIGRKSKNFKVNLYALS